MFTFFTSIPHYNLGSNISSLTTAAATAAGSDLEQGLVTLCLFKLCRLIGFNLNNSPVVRPLLSAQGKPQSGRGSVLPGRQPSPVGHFYRPVSISVDVIVLGQKSIVSNVGHTSGDATVASPRPGARDIAGSPVVVALGAFFVVVVAIVSWISRHKFDDIGSRGGSHMWYAPSIKRRRDIDDASVGVTRRHTGRDGLCLPCVIGRRRPNARGTIIV